MNTYNWSDRHQLLGRKLGSEILLRVNKEDLTERYTVIDSLVTFYDETGNRMPHDFTLKEGLWRIKYNGMGRYPDIVISDGWQHYSDAYTPRPPSERYFRIITQ